jgi:lambda family phage portal protein
VNGLGVPGEVSSRAGVLDRAIAVVSPKWAARRAVARVQLDQVRRIGGAMRTRRAPDAWRVNDPATRRHEAQQGKPMSRWARAQIREIFDLNPFAVKVLSALLNSAVGFGITATVKGPKAAKKAWLLWEKYCDYDGVQDLYGLQELITSTFLVDGEVFVVIRAEPNPSGIPVQLQVLDADMLDGTLALANTRIRDGIEYQGEGGSGRPVAYWFRQSRELGAFGNPVRVPAEQVIHLYKRKRPGIRRGRSHFEPVLDVLEDVDDYLEAEGVRKKIAACFVGFRAIGEDWEDPAQGTVEADPFDANEPPVESFYPGMIINGRPGEKMEFGQPSQDQGVGEYMRWAGLRAGAGAQVTYERATGDLSNVNYSSYRAGDLEYQRFIGRTQWLSLMPQCLYRIGDEVGRAMTVAGIVGRAPEVTWSPPPFGSVDPEKDAKTEQLEMAGLQRSWREIIQSRGRDADELAEEIAADDKMLADKKLKRPSGTQANAAPAGSAEANDQNQGGQGDQAQPAE